MSFNNRREFLFVYSVKDANPNGDPLNANQPRFDSETGQILVSDVRIKRTIRDQWMRNGLSVFVDSEPKTLKTRIEELKKEFNVKTGKEALEKCIDTRLFGVTYALENESFSLTGPVQFKWGRSLHKAKIEFIQGTAAFSTKDEKEQRSFRNEYLVPFVVLGVYAIANQYPSEESKATDNDVDYIKDGLWEGTTNLITRSKFGHQPRLLMEIRYKEDFEGMIGALDEKINLTRDRKLLNDDEQLSLRDLKTTAINIDHLNSKLLLLKDQIEKINLIIETGLLVEGLDDMESMLGDRFQLLGR